MNVHYRRVKGKEETPRDPHLDGGVHLHPTDDVLFTRVGLP